MALEVTDLEVTKKQDYFKRVVKIENFNEMSQVKLREGVKKLLDGLKEHKRETYDDIISRLIAEHSDIPLEVLKSLGVRIDDVQQGRVYSVEEAKKKVFDDEARPDI